MGFRKCKWLAKDLVRFDPSQSKACAWGGGALKHRDSAWK